MFANIKLIAAGVGVVAVLALAYTYYSRGEKVETLTKENTQLSVANKGLEETVEKTGQSGAVTDQTVSNASAEKEEKRDTLEGVAEAADQKVEAIQREAALNKPSRPVRPPVVKDPEVAVPAVDPDAERDAKVSQVRIDSLWDSYCVAVPSNLKCAQPTVAK